MIAQNLIIARAVAVYVMLVLVVVVWMRQGVSFVRHVRLNLHFVSWTNRIGLIILLVHEISARRLFSTFVLQHR